MIEDSLETIVAATRPVVYRILAPHGRKDDVEDVLQDIWISASQGHHDPALGKLAAWVTRIAQRRAWDHLRALERAGKAALAGAAAPAAKSFEDDSYVEIVPDHAEEVIDRLESMDQLRTVLSMVRDVIGNELQFRRTLALLVTYDDDAKTAAANLGVSVEALRESRRTTVRTAQVIAKALQIRERGEPVTIRHLLSCLPEDEESGQWLRAMSVAIVRKGGFQHVDAASLTEVTGWSYNTTRQYLAETKALLAIARTVLETGEPIAPKTSTEPKKPSMKRTGTHG